MSFKISNSRGSWEALAATSYSEPHFLIALVKIPLPTGQSHCSTVHWWTLNTRSPMPTNVPKSQALPSPCSPGNRLHAQPASLSPFTQNLSCICILPVKPKPHDYILRGIWEVNVHLPLWTVSIHTQEILQRRTLQKIVATKHNKCPHQVHTEPCWDRRRRRGMGTTHDTGWQST